MEKPSTCAWTWIAVVLAALLALAALSFPSRSSPAPASLPPPPDPQFLGASFLHRAVGGIYNAHNLTISLGQAGFHPSLVVIYTGDESGTQTPTWIGVNGTQATILKQNANGLFDTIAYVKNPPPEPLNVSVGYVGEFADNWIIGAASFVKTSGNPTYTGGILQIGSTDLQYTFPVVGPGDLEFGMFEEYTGPASHHPTAVTALGTVTGEFNDIWGTGAIVSSTVNCIPTSLDVCSAAADVGAGGTGFNWTISAAAGEDNQILAVLIHGGFDANFTVTTNGLEADFVSHVVGGTSPFSYFWDFDLVSGNHSTVANPSWFYAAVTKTYTVELNVTDAASLKVTYANTVSIVNPPTCPAGYSGVPPRCIPPGGGGPPPPARCTNALACLWNDTLYPRILLVLRQVCNLWILIFLAIAAAVAATVRRSARHGPGPNPPPKDGAK